jgi:Zn-dependent peptidase ImmA (M78 family)
MTGRLLFVTLAALTARRLKDALRTTDMIDVVNRLGIVYEELPLPQRIMGFTGRMDKRSYIVVGRDMPRPWKRAVAFHELGHIQLHGHLPDHFFIVENTFFPVGRFEREANEFAAAYLIPDKALSMHGNMRVAAAELQVPVALFEFWRPPSKQREAL